MQLLLDQVARQQRHAAAASIIIENLSGHPLGADLSQVLIGGADVGAALVAHKGVALISATGSTRMGRQVGPAVAARFRRSILELGGNNAGIVCPSADLDMALRAIAFGAMGHGRPALHHDAAALRA